MVRNTYLWMKGEKQTFTDLLYMRCLDAEGLDIGNQTEQQSTSTINFIALVHNTPPELIH